MTDIEDAVREVRENADRFGLVALAREAGVPYTTLHTFARRGWRLKSLDMMESLIAAGARLNAEPEAASPVKAA